jgi:hypothetical protein
MVLSSMNNPNMECDHMQYQKDIACIPLFSSKTFFHFCIFLLLWPFDIFSFFYSKAKINHLKELQHIQYSRYCIGSQSLGYHFWNGAEKILFLGPHHGFHSSVFSSQHSIPYFHFSALHTTPRN